MNKQWVLLNLGRFSVSCQTEMYRWTTACLRYLNHNNVSGVFFRLFCLKRNTLEDLTQQEVNNFNNKPGSLHFRYYKFWTRDPFVSTFEKMKIQ